MVGKRETSEGRQGLVRYLPSTEDDGPLGIDGHREKLRSRCQLGVSI